MSKRMFGARQALFDALQDLKTPGNWDHILSQRGMFSYTGLNPKQCRALLQERHVYLPETGRISMTGVNRSNARRIAEYIDEVVRREVLN
jgi:aspartate/tyrosine/aromatic aminotransferase